MYNNMRLSSLSVVFAYLCLRASAACFYPNGTQAGKEQQPCNDSGHSMCCLLNPDSSQNADVCTSDGLCIPSYNGWLFRDTCTDKTWKDPGCLNICTTGQNDDGNSSASDYAPITVCADGSLCCGTPGMDQSRDCCTKRKGQWLVNHKLVDTKPASLTATAQTTTGAAATSTPTANGNVTAANETTSAATPTPAPSSNHTGAIVGGVVGGIAGVVILGLTFWYFMIRRSLAQRRNLPQTNSYEPYSQGQGQPMTDQKYWQQPSEAPVQQGHFRTELGTDTGHQAPELDSAQVK